MTRTLLVSASLLALVVTAHPVIPDSHDYDFNNSDNSIPAAEIQSAVQAIFESRTKGSSDSDSHPSDNYDIHFVSPERQQSYLAALGDNAIKALLPLGESGEDGEISEDEKRLRQMLVDAAAAEGGAGVAQSGPKMDDVDGEGWPVSPSETVKSLAASEPESDNSPASTPETDDGLSLTESSDVAAQPDESAVIPLDISALFADPTIITFVTSSALALLIVACVGAALYAIYCVRGLVGSDAAWEILKGAGLEKRGRIALPGKDGDDDDDESDGDVVEKVVLNEKDVEKGRVVLLISDGEKNDADVDCASSVGDETDYLDALDTTPILNHTILPPSTSGRTASPLPRWSELARKDSHAELRRQASLSNLNLTLTQTSTPPSSLSRETSKALLRELAAVAAAEEADSDPPAISSSTSSARSDSPALPASEFASTPARHRLDLRAARQGNSNTQGSQARERQVLDFALAMQLGPSSINGTGVLGALTRVGADPAWVLNVMLALFGWVAVIIGGQGTRTESRRERRSMIAR